VSAEDYGVLDANRNVNSAVVDAQIRRPIPSEIPLIIGDCVQNLRSALDYMVWEMVIAVGGQPSKRNAFPICTTAEAFDVEVDKKRLRGISDPELIAKIKTLQPYKNGNGPEQDPLFILDELTNINKHRRILLAGLKADFVLGRSNLSDLGTHLSIDISFTVVHDDTQIPAPVAAGQMEMYHQIIASIAFNEGCAQGKRVLELLDAIATYVDGVVGTFEFLIT
jgi:hypothetical protein